MRKLNIKTGILFVFIAVSILLSGCTKKGELGTASNPIKVFFIPSVDAKVIEDNSKEFKNFFEANTPYKFEVVIPQSYIAVVEAFGTKRADVALLNTFGYILANEKYGVEAKLTGLRHGTDTYQSQIVVHTDSKLNKISDLAGKKVAFVDAASASGYLLAMKKLNDQKVVPSETVFAGKHDNVISMVYNKQVDGGATFYSPDDEDGIQDARRLVKTQYPDVEKKVKRIDLSDAIPNDAVSFRKDLPEDIKNSIVEAFVKFVSTEDGKKSFKKINGFDGVKKASDADYAPAKEMLKKLIKEANEEVKK